LVVESTHEFYPSGRCERIKTRAQSVIEKIRSMVNLGEKDLSFDIVSLPRSQQSVMKVLRDTYEATEKSEEVRVVFSDDSMNEQASKSLFAKNKLFVVVQESSNLGGIFSSGGDKGCKIVVKPDRAARIVEDVFVDIFLGRWMTNTRVLNELVVAQGLSGLYRAKAKYFRQNSARSWITNISRDASYAPLASLNRADDDDIEGRADAALKEWMSFAEGLTVRSLPAAAAISSDVAVASFERLPKLGGQLPVRSIKSTLAKLPDGQYTVVILRRSSAVRKQPKIKDGVRSIFGRRARINSFRIFTADSFSSNRNLIAHLIRSGFIVGISVETDNGALRLNRILTGE